MIGGDDVTDTDIKKLQEAAETAKKSVDKAARESAEKIIKRNLAKELIKAESDEFWHWWGKTTPPDNQEKEPLPPGDPKKGSGSKNKGRKKKPKRKSRFETSYLDV